MSSSFPDPADDLARAVAETLRAAFDAFPRLVADPEQLATRLAPALSSRLAEAVAAAGGTASDLVRSLAIPAPASAAGGALPAEARVLAVLARHPGGRDPGLTPEALTTLTNLSASALGHAVSALIQSGDLVRDGWLVRIPQADDQLPASRIAEGNRSGESRHANERRAIGDRRAVGERRLFDRRSTD